MKEDLIAYGAAITHIPSHMEKGAKGGVFRKKTDCDFAAGIKGQAYFFDAKVCAEPQFNVKSLILRESKVHQYQFLLSSFDRGSITGYLIWFYNERKIAWLPIENVDKVGASFTWENLLIGSQEDSTMINLERLSKLGGKSD